MGITTKYKKRHAFTRRHIRGGKKNSQMVNVAKELKDLESQFNNIGNRISRGEEGLNKNRLKGEIKKKELEYYNTINSATNQLVSDVIERRNMTSRPKINRVLAASIGAATLGAVIFGAVQ